MSSFDDLIEEARFYARASSVRSNLVTDAQLLLVGNKALEEARKKLIEIESNLVYANDTITLVSGTGEYTPTFSHDGFLEDGVFLTGEENPLRFVTEEYKVHYDTDNITQPPDAYYVTEDGKVGFLNIPDDSYDTATIYYWKHKDEFQIASGETGDAMPFGGIWDGYVEARLEFAISKIYGRDLSIITAEIVGRETEAINSAYRLGIRKRRNRSDFFSAPGV
jgi:hypothetical protein